jgi:amino acid transporter
MGYESTQPETSTGSGNALRRRLGTLESAALIFAGVSASGAVFSLWTFSYGTSGPAFFWAYPLIALAVGFMCFVWAELASRYPFAGTFYEWPRILLGQRKSAEPISWWIAWIYLFGLVATLVTLYVAIANTTIILFGWTPSTHLTVLLSIGAMLLGLGLNVSGIERLGKIGLIGVGGEVIATAVIATATLVLGASHSPSILTNTGGQSFHAWLPGFIGAALFMPIWALYSFEGGGLLGEETKDAGRAAPRAILIAFFGSIVAAMYEIFAFVLSTAHPIAAMSAEQPITENIERVLPDWVGTLFSVIVLELLLLAVNAFLSYSSRQLFGMARGREVPFSRTLSSLWKGTPVACLVLIGVISIIPLALSSEVAVLIGGATAVVYVAYVLILSVVLFARFKGWPKMDAPFSLGRYGPVVSVLAWVAAVAIGANLLWPRDSTNPVWQLGIRAAYWMVGIPILLGIAMRVWRRVRRGPGVIPDPVDAELESARLGLTGADPASAGGRTAG